MELTVTKDIAAGTERVWQVVTDIDGSARTLSGVQQVERLDGGGPFGIGTKWRETRKMFGKEATEEMVVTDIDEGRSYTVHAESNGTIYTSVFTLEPVGEMTRLSMRFGGEPSGALGKVLANTLGRLFAGATRKMLQRDLDDIAAAAERG